jgi:hypothetical protein
MQQFLRYGDEAASVLLKHPGIAEGVVEKGGTSAVKALGVVTPQNGRRIAMLLDGELAAHSAKHPELLDEIAKYGDQAAVFVWEHKGALAVGTVLTAFLTNPEPFITGAKDLAAIGGNAVAKPIAEGVAKGTNWTAVILFVLGLGALLAVGLLRRFVWGRSVG